MTAVLAAAARSTTQILDLADRAAVALRGAGPRSNAAGVLSNPANFLDDLRAARELIDRAIVLHAGTNWPSESDYHAL
jgi:hypothetical protein